MASSLPDASVSRVAVVPAVLGVDGCPGGWVGALVHADGTIDWCFWSIEETAEMVTAAPVVAIDMPIGLATAGRRACDVAARDRLGTARSSVFPVPSRPVLAPGDYRDACTLAHARGEPAPSKQLWGLRRRILELDHVMTPARQAHVVECHPEVAYLALLGARPPSKRTAAGVGRRLAGLLSDGFLSDVGTLADVPAEARVDDALDALVCAWTARRWAAGVADVLGDGMRDEKGLRMQTVA